MDAGFNYQFSGVRMATSLTGAGSYQKTAIADDAKIQRRVAWKTGNELSHDFDRLQTHIQ